MIVMLDNNVIIIYRLTKLGGENKMLYAIKVSSNSYLSLVNSDEGANLKNNEYLMNQVFNDYDKAMKFIHLLLNESECAIMENIDTDEDIYLLDEEFQREYLSWEYNNYDLDGIIDYIEDTVIIDEDSFNV